MVGDKFLTNKFLTFDLQSVLIFILTNDIMFFIYTQCHGWYISIISVQTKRYWEWSLNFIFRSHLKACSDPVSNVFWNLLCLSNERSLIYIWKIWSLNFLCRPGGTCGLLQPLLLGNVLGKLILIFTPTSIFGTSGNL